MGVTSSKEPDRDRGRRIAQSLMAVRSGEVPLGQVLDSIDEKGRELERAVLAAKLPDDADSDAINGFLVRAYRDAWFGHA
jgi:hypothetical protein